MAHHGGRTVPRAHRPTMSGAQPPAAVSLQAPRPDTDRAANEYVETPFRALCPAAAADKAPPLRVARPALPAPPPRPVTKQPQASFTKECGGGGGAAAAGNIICAGCGRCRCEPCRAPRALPQRWLCGNACLCSAGAAIDYASCLCCVKALYYHCSDSDAGATCADEPCSCAPPRRLARWACLGALAAALPCLLCYWPLRACQRAAEAAYARHSRRGCRCRQDKRLLPG